MVKIDIKLGSCLDPKMYPDELVDLILCDPPFYSEKKEVRQIRKNTKNKLEPIQTFENYFEDWDFFCSILQDYLKKSGYFCFKTDDITSRKVFDITSKYFKYVYSIIWDKKKIGIGTKWRKQHELIDIYQKEIITDEEYESKEFYETIDIYTHADVKKTHWERTKISKVPFKTLNNEVKKITLKKSWHGSSRKLAFRSIIRILDEKTGMKGVKKKKHINQTPPALWIPFLKYMVPQKGAIILDPFCGTGSIPIAMQIRNISQSKYFGIEIDLEHYKTARDLLGLSGNLDKHF